MSTILTSSRSHLEFRRKAENVSCGISDQAMLAMPEDQYMESVQLDFFKGRLLALEQLLLIRARGAEETLASDATGADPIDRASAEEEHTMALTGRARDASQLMAVRAALKRIDLGEYGYCRETGEPIGVSRLLICPTAELTTEAQQRQEDRSRRFRLPGNV